MSGVQWCIAALVMIPVVSGIALSFLAEHSKKVKVRVTEAALGAEVDDLMDVADVLEGHACGHDCPPCQAMWREYLQLIHQHDQLAAEKSQLQK